MDTPLAYRLDKAADQLGLSAQTLRRAEKAGDIQFRRYGRTTVVTREELERFRDEHLKIGINPALSRQNKAAVAKRWAKAGATSDASRSKGGAR